MQNADANLPILNFKYSGEGELDITNVLTGGNQNLYVSDVIHTAKDYVEIFIDGVDESNQLDTLGLTITVRDGVATMDISLFSIASGSEVIIRRNAAISIDSLNGRFTLTPNVVSQRLSQVEINLKTIREILGRCLQFDTTDNGEVERSLDNIIHLKNNQSITSHFLIKVDGGLEFIEIPSIETVVVDIQQLKGMIGDLSYLQTTDKANLVGAINSTLTIMGELSNLQTVNKANLVDAINELVGVSSGITAAADRILIDTTNNKVIKGDNIKETTDSTDEALDVLTKVNLYNETDGILNPAECVGATIALVQDTTWSIDFKNGDAVFYYKEENKTYQITSLTFDISTLPEWSAVETFYFRIKHIYAYIGSSGDVETTLLDHSSLVDDGYIYLGYIYISSLGTVNDLTVESVLVRPALCMYDFLSKLDDKFSASAEFVTSTIDFNLRAKNGIELSGLGINFGQLTPAGFDNKPLLKKTLNVGLLSYIRKDNGTTATGIDPTVYLNMGVETAVPDFQFTISRVTITRSGTLFYYPGTEVFATMIDAKVSHNTNPIIIDEDEIPFFSIITRQDAPYLDDTDRVLFISEVSNSLDSATAIGEHNSLNGIDGSGTYHINKEQYDLIQQRADNNSHIATASGWILASIVRQFAPHNIRLLPEIYQTSNTVNGVSNNSFIIPPNSVSHRLPVQYSSNNEFYQYSPNNSSNNLPSGALVIKKAGIYRIEVSFDGVILSSMASNTNTQLSARAIGVLPYLSTSLLGGSLSESSELALGFKFDALRRVLFNTTGVSREVYSGYHYANYSDADIVDGLDYFSYKTPSLFDISADGLGNLRRAMKHDDMSNCKMEFIADLPKHNGLSIDHYLKFYVTCYLPYSNQTTAANNTINGAMVTLTCTYLAPTEKDIV